MTKVTPIVRNPSGLMIIGRRIVNNPSGGMTIGRQIVNNPIGGTTIGGPIVIDPVVDGRVCANASPVLCNWQSYRDRGK
jgi:hypothetical protein